MKGLMNMNIQRLASKCPKKDKKRDFFNKKKCQKIDLDKYFIISLKNLHHGRVYLLHSVENG